MGFGGAVCYIGCIFTYYGNGSGVCEGRIHIMYYWWRCDDKSGGIFRDRLGILNME